jgi:hypothetical protein
MSNDKSQGCCDEPPCPSVSLLCNSISASKSKCGYSEYSPYVSTPPKKYLTETYQEDRDITTCCLAGSSVLPCGGFGLAYHILFHRDYDPSACTVSTTSVTCIGNHLNCDGSVHDSFGCGESTFDTASSSTYKSFSSAGSSAACSTPVCASGTRTDSGSTFSHTLSNEYTTADLISNTVDALPAYATCFSCVTHDEDSACDEELSAGQGCICSAFRNLSSDETSYTIRRFKYKFRFTGSVTCRLKILWKETFKPTLTAGVDFCGTHYNAGSEDPDPSHWTKTSRSYTKSFSGNPCGPNASSNPTAPHGLITEWDSTEFTVNEPTTNGTTYITDIRWTILDGNNDTDVYDPAPIDYTDPCNPIAAEPNCIPAG